MATGEDRQENALDLAGDFEWVRALDANGKSIRINKADMVELIRREMPIATRERNGLLSSGIIFNTMTDKGLVMSNDKNAIDNAKETGFYKHDDSLFGTTSGHGILLVFKGGSYIAQLDISNRGLLFLRFYHGFGEWTSWQAISFT